MSISGKIDSVVDEISVLGDKAEELLTKTQKLIFTLDSETKKMRLHMSRIKKLLGFEEKRCPICAKGVPDHCLESCHHCFCRTCASRMLNAPPRKCFICRGNVLASFKIFSV